MKSMTRITGAAAAVLVSAFLISCGGESTEGQAEAKAVALHIQGAGATFPEPLYQEWIARHEASHEDVALTYKGVGSGEGIKRFIAGTVDFGASDAAMNDREIEQVERGVRLVPATAGMVVLAYNLPGVEGGLKLPRDVYVDIFLGKIWRWDDPRIVAANPDLKLPPKLIQTVARRDSSGTTYAFTNHLSTVSQTWREEGPGTGKQIDWPGAMMASGNEGVAQRVKITHGSIGYMEYGFARRLGLPMAVLENKAGNYVRPDAGSGRAALAAAAEADLPDDLRLFLPDPEGSDSYPIVSLSWILLYATYPESERAAAIKEALTWGVTEGQAIAEEMGYIPLPDVLAAKAAEAITEIR